MGGGGSALCCTCCVYVIVDVVIVCWLWCAPKSNGNGLRGIYVHGRGFTVGGHNFVEFFRVAAPRWYSDSRIISEGSDVGFVDLLVDNS